MATVMYKWRKIYVMKIQNSYIEEILNKSEFYENENENFMSIKQKKNLSYG